MEKRSKLILMWILFLCDGMVAQGQNEVSVAVSDSILLSEIQVVATKPLVKVEVDKTVYSVEDDLGSKTNTLLEISRKVPMATVDGDDNIRVNGSTSFKIYMNNKPSSILSGNPRDVLRSIPASTIKKIEVITEPGAKYDAEGVGGVLNIITKCIVFEGYNMNLNAMLLKNVCTASGFVTMKYGQFALSGNYSYNRCQDKLESDYIRRQLTDPNESVLSVYNRMQSKNPFHYGALESSFEVDSLNLITLSAALDLNTSQSTTDGNYCMISSTEELVYS